MLRVPCEKDKGSHLEVWILGVKASQKNVFTIAAGLIEPQYRNIQ